MTSLLLRVYRCHDKTRRAPHCTPPPPRNHAHIRSPAAHRLPTSPGFDGKPNFAQTFFDDSAATTVFARWFGLPRTPISLPLPDTCTYDRFAAGLGCTLQFTEPISTTRVQIGIDACAASSVPYVSLSCRGPWCTNFMTPCSRDVTVGPGDCGTGGLVCRKPWPGTTDIPGVANSFRGQLINWLTQFG